MINIYLTTDKKIRVAFKGDAFQDILSLVKEYRCKYIPDDKAWELLDQTRISNLIKSLKKISNNISMDNDIALFLKSKVNIFDNNSVDFEPFNIEGLKNITLYPHQYGDIKFLSSRTKALLANCCGSGKTISLIASALYLKQLGLVNKVLIVSPSAIINEWTKMIKKYTEYKYTNIKPKIKQKDNIKYKIKRQYDTDTFFNIISCDSIEGDFLIDKKIKEDKKSIKYKASKLNIKNNIELMKKYDYIIIDEAHKLTNKKTLRSHAIRKMIKDVKYVHLATATPVQNKLEDLYNLFNLYLNNKLINYMTFRREYCIMGGFANLKIIGYRNIEQFVNILKPYIRRITREQLSDKYPKKIEQRKYVKLSSQQREFYNKINDQIITIKNDPDKTKKINQAKQLALISYLKQSCINTYQLDKTTHYASKIDEMMDAIDYRVSNNEKTIVYCFYKETSKFIVDCISKKYGCLYLDSVNNDVEKIKEEFLKDENKVLVMTKVGAEGLNLEMASCFMLVTLEFNPKVIEQLTSRIDRITQKHIVTIMYFIAEDTYEERIIDIIDSKTELADSVSDAIVAMNVDENNLIWDNV